MLNTVIAVVEKSCSIKPEQTNPTKGMIINVVAQNIQLLVATSLLTAEVFDIPT